MIVTDGLTYRGVLSRTERFVSIIFEILKLSDCFTGLKIMCEIRLVNETATMVTLMLIERSLTNLVRIWQYAKKTSAFMRREVRTCSFRF